MKDELLQVRVSIETKETLQIMAKQLGLTTSAFIRMILLQKIKDEAEKTNK
jgi:antitoxin component of RelBE/YafQ-DinJ toxin-antitoxin module